MRHFRSPSFTTYDFQRKAGPDIALAGRRNAQGTRIRKLLPTEVIGITDRRTFENFTDRYQATAKCNGNGKLKKS